MKIGLDDKSLAVQVLGLDPGTFETGFAVFSKGKVTVCGVMKNEDIVDWLYSMESGILDFLVIEMINSQGMAVGIETFETCVWIGRFIQSWSELHETPSIRVFRRDVKMELCGSAKAKDANIRQALIDRFGEVGTKKNPGAMYGMKSHTWPALAVIVAALQKGLIHGQGTVD